MGKTQQQLYEQATTSTAGLKQVLEGLKARALLPRNDASLFRIVLPGLLTKTSPAIFVSVLDNVFEYTHINNCNGCMWMGGRCLMLRRSVGQKSGKDFSTSKP